MRRNPMTRLLSGRTLPYLLGMFALVEAIFLAEEFTTLMESVVRNGGTALDLAFLLTLTAPEIVDFALPLILFLALYFAITGAREDNELMVCAAAGVPWTRIPRYALWLGCVCAVVSVIFAGFLTPLGKFAQRLAIHHLETRRIVEEITSDTPKSTLRTLNGRTVIASPPASGGAARGNLFTFEDDAGEGWRVSQAEDWTILGPDESGGYAIRLMDFRDYTGRSGAAETRQDEGGRLTTAFRSLRVSVRSLEVDFRLNEVIDAVDRNRRGDERLLFTMAELTEGALTPDRRFGSVLGRALLCPFAALLAVAAAALAGARLGRFAALPLGVVAILAADTVVPTALAGLDGAAPGVWGAGLAAAALLLLTLPAAILATQREALIAPRRGRA